MTAVIIDEAVELLLSGEEARACEHRDHGRRAYHADGGEQWVSLFWPCGCAPGEVLVFCAAYIRAWESPTFTVRCMACGRIDRPTAFYRVLGPVGT